MLKLFVSLQTRVMELRDRQDGQAFAEYGLILAIIAIGLFVALDFLRGQLVTVFDTVASKL